MRWNPWHGCRKLSEGCRHCYVYRMDARNERDASEIKKNASTFHLPVSKNRKGEYKYPSGTEFSTCFTSDFFLEEADEWRPEAWRIIKERSDCRFFIITKRIDRFEHCIPDDWGGESGQDARVCQYDWVLDLREQCVKANVSFYYHQTGAKLMKDGSVYHIPKDKQNEQAERAGINFSSEENM